MHLLYVDLSFTDATMSFALANPYVYVLNHMVLSYAWKIAFEIFIDWSVTDWLIFIKVHVTNVMHKLWVCDNNMTE